MELSNQCKEIVLGSLLGDGSLIMRKRYRRARFEIRHSVIQKEYFFWKAKQLKEISGKHCCRLQPADGWSKNKKLHYHSTSNDWLTNIYYLTHKKGEFIINKSWLGDLTPTSLLVWWLDDGSLIKNSRQGVFCTEGFNRQNILALSGYLKNKWGVATHISRRGKYNQLKIYSTEELKKFLRIILPFLQVKEMLPKVLLLYKDPKLQKRWISEVGKLTDFSERIIGKYVKEKRSRWKNFRE